MKKPPCSPGRPLRNEALSLLPAAAFAAAIALAFPREAFTWKGGAAAAKEAAASCAFVELSGEAAQRAREMVRSPFLPAGGSVRELQADLSLSTVAEDAPESILSISERSRPAPAKRMAWREPPLPRGMAAPDPVLPPPAAEAEEPAFPRRHMLEDRVGDGAAAKNLDK